MKNIFIFLLISISASIVNAQTPKLNSKSGKVQIVEASCGQCQFKMEGKSCDLAVRINGKSYFVDGTKIDDHGDAHAKNGFCEKIRKAEVQGNIVNKRFVATSFKLLPESEK
ncbi:hypothetical protein SAMN05421813_10897 [Daejeonella rubra]|uniref:Glutaminyl-tRNA synthetase n=1 Tax=Daejeonella rubra TaxID=990371 RepID=A0A1G9RPK1_9SPHI|nr:DUF6370 family protein [Daejeonella rubra]SDM24980.1 hypothetical protein SAMN05421813_10897 [Daejeonella rubra]